MFVFCDIFYRYRILRVWFLLEYLFIFNLKMLYFFFFLVINKKYIKDREMFCLYEKRKNLMLYVEISNDIENSVKLKI